MVLKRWRRRKNSRGNAYVAEYIITIAMLALVVSSALAITAGPDLFKTFRKTQRAAAAPIP